MQKRITETHHTICRVISKEKKLIDGKYFVEYEYEDIPIITRRVQVMFLTFWITIKRHSIRQYMHDYFFSACFGASMEYEWPKEFNDEPVETFYL